MKKGIDVSTYQGNIDWRKVKLAGVDFAILKCNAGKEVAERFETNYSAAKAVGMPVGAYLYSYALSPAEARAEATACITTLAGKKFEYPIFFDIERNAQFALGAAAVSEIIRAFCETLEDAGYFAGVYASKSHLENYVELDVRERYCIWIAHYGVEKTSYTGKYAMWQFTDKGRVDGISGNVDVSNCYENFGYIQELGMNGFAPAAEIIPDKSRVSATLPTVRLGSTGNYISLLQSILNIKGYDCGKIDGIFGEMTKKSVENYQTDSDGELIPDGIVGPKTWKSLFVFD